MTRLITEILRCADAKLIVDEVQKVLDAEKRKRQEFYTIIDEDTKAMVLPFPSKPFLTKKKT